MKYALVIAALLLGGCTLDDAFVKKDQPLAVQYKYIVTQIPDEMLQDPPPTYKINPEASTDKDASKWMVDSESRYIEIEKKLKAIKKYQDDKLNDLLKNKSIKPEDIIKN